MDDMDKLPIAIQNAERLWRDAALQLEALFRVAYWVENAPREEIDDDTYNALIEAYEGLKRAVDRRRERVAKLWGRVPGRSEP